MYTKEEILATKKSLEKYHIVANKPDKNNDIIFIAATTLSLYCTLSVYAV